MLAIQNFQQRLYARYKNSLSLPPTYHYLYGNPVEPLVPVETTQGGVCIIGAYPPARRASLGLEPDVPVGDLDHPFPIKPHFDGARVHGLTGGMVLADSYLAPLGLCREQCWLTYLVKVFLFGDEHLAKYRRLGCLWPEWETRGHFWRLAQQSLAWLEEELALARPCLVITLGVEVAGVLQQLQGPEASRALLGGGLQEFRLDQAVYPVIHLAEPDLISQPGSAAHRQHWKAHVPASRQVVERLIK